MLTPREIRAKHFKNLEGFDCVRSVPAHHIKVVGLEKVVVTPAVMAWLLNDCLGEFRISFHRYEARIGFDNEMDAMLFILTFA